MMKNKDSQSPIYEVSENGEGGVTIYFHGRMDASNATSIITGISALLKGRLLQSLTIDLKDVSYLDDFGALVFVDLKNRMMEGTGQFYLKNANDKVREIIAVLNLDAIGKKVSFIKKRPPGAFVRLGEATIRHAGDLKYLISFIGSVVLSLFYVIAHPRSLRTNDTFLYMQKTGFDALPIVGLISFLLGMILAFMSAMQLKQFGANIYVASLVSLAMVRELGPVMTAIIVAGRSGSAFAAEIGTMKVSEEVDALFTMGFDPTHFLVMPKIIASLIVVPLLVLFSDLFAILGSLMVGVFMLDLTVNAYLTQSIRFLTLLDLFWSFVKSGVFALLIAWVGCLRGFQVRGGADSVGQATTSAVVSSLFLIILSDSVFAIIRVYWG